MKVDVNNITLNYIKAGEGSPLLLLHGNGEDAQIFDLLINKLKTDFTVYAIDSRNHGESSKTDDFSYETIMEDTFQFMQKMKLENVSIVGFSDGAIVALMMSINYPDIFHRMVLLGVNLKPSDFKQECYNYLADEYEQHKDPLFKMMLEQPMIELDELKGIQTKTLVVGAEDDLYNEKLFENIADTISDATLKIMKGHNHGSYIIHQDVLYPTLIEFLK